MTDHDPLIDPMLVRMARAIAASQGTSDWHSCIDMARASLVALRDPSNEMLEAAIPGLPDWGDLPEDWRAMIDHVLGESNEINDNRVIPSTTKIAG
jgi:hypothetical protein